MPAIDEDVPVELNISLEKLRDILVKAREFDLEDFPDEPEPGEDPVSLEDRETLLDAGDDPTEIELRELIEDLNDDEVVDLIAITWIGRGDFDPGDLAGARALSQQAHRQLPDGHAHLARLHHRRRRRSGLADRKSGITARFVHRPRHRSDDGGFWRYSNIRTLRATSPAFIARKASLISPRRPRREIIESRSRRPWR
jgi:Protein of unknown function (DUF3775)